MLGGPAENVGEDVKRTNLKLRHSCGAWDGHAWDSLRSWRTVVTRSLCIFVWYDFVRVHGSLKVTPAIKGWIDGSCMDDWRTSGVG